MASSPGHTQLHVKEAGLRSWSQDSHGLPQQGEAAVLRPGQVEAPCR